MSEESDCYTCKRPYGTTGSCPTCENFRKGEEAEYAGKQPDGTPEPDAAARFGFGEALKILRAGRYVARDGWHGKGMYLGLQTPQRNSKMTLPYIYIGGAIGTDGAQGICPWLASQTDILAEDWGEAPPPHTQVKW